MVDRKAGSCASDISGAGWEIGVMAGLKKNGPSLRNVEAFGLTVCQLVNWDMSLWQDELAERVRQEAQERQVRIAALWAGVPGPHVWDFVEGPAVLGLVPARYRAERVAALEDAGRFAATLGVPAVVTHLGFIPENPGDPLFQELVAATREVAETLGEMGLEFWFETGQETPVTMLRTLEAVGRDNVAINLDPANLILYGKANPVDALELFGTYVRNVHAKDGLYPTDPMELGREVKLGEGAVDFPRLLDRLRELGFCGELIIEREIEGDEQKRDITDAVDYLRTLTGVSRGG